MYSVGLSSTNRDSFEEMWDFKIILSECISVVIIFCKSDVFIVVGTFWKSPKIDITFWKSTKWLSLGLEHPPLAFQLLDFFYWRDFELYTGLLTFGTLALISKSWDSSNFFSRCARFQVCILDKFREHWYLGALELFYKVPNMKNWTFCKSSI